MITELHSGALKKSCNIRLKKLERHKLSLQGNTQDILGMQDLQSEILYALWIKTAHVCTLKDDWKIHVQEMQQIFLI